MEINNPKVFHSIDLDMVRALTEFWRTLDESPIQGLLMRPTRSTKRPAFCAGGDVKRVYESGIDASQGPHGVGAPGVYTAEFFRQLYVLNHMMNVWDRPQISLWDGIVMGGGVGISIYGKYRVATENTVFAMPETSIGVIPDIGSMYWMTHRLDWSVASYLALTGARLKAPDLLHTGIATHYVPSNQLDELQLALVEASESSVSLTSPTETNDIFQPVLESFHQDPHHGTVSDGTAVGGNTADVLSEGPLLVRHADILHDVFGSIDTSMEAIMARLEERTIGHMQKDKVSVEDDPSSPSNWSASSLPISSSQFCKETLTALESASPTSLKVTLEGLKRGRTMSLLEDGLQMEFRMFQTCLKPGSDFYRGIRSVLVDKDRNPQWIPNTLEEVTDETVEQYFAPLDTNEWALPTTLQQQTVPSKDLSTGLVSDRSINTALF